MVARLTGGRPEDRLGFAVPQGRRPEVEHQDLRAQGSLPGGGSQGRHALDRLIAPLGAASTGTSYGLPTPIPRSVLTSTPPTRQQSATFPSTTTGNAHDAVLLGLDLRRRIGPHVEDPNVAARAGDAPNQLHRLVAARAACSEHLDRALVSHQTPPSVRCARLARGLLRSAENEVQHGA